MIPKQLKKYFWDVDFGKLDPRKTPDYIIERILEYGNIEASKWMLKEFNKSQIKEILIKGRRISHKSASYWAEILNVPKNKVLCLKKFYQKMQKTHWPY